MYLIAELWLQSVKPPRWTPSLCCFCVCLIAPIKGKIQKLLFSMCWYWCSGCGDDETLVSMLSRWWKTGEYDCFILTSCQQGRSVLSGVPARWRPAPGNVYCNSNYVLHATVSNLQHSKISKLDRQMWWVSWHGRGIQTARLSTSHYISHDASGFLHR